MSTLSSQLAYQSRYETYSTTNPEKNHRQLYDKISAYESHNQSKDCISNSSKQQKRLNARNSQQKRFKNTFKTQPYISHLSSKFSQSPQLSRHLSDDKLFEANRINKIIFNLIVPTMHLDHQNANISSQDALLLFISTSKQKEKELQLKISRLERQLKATCKALGCVNSCVNSIGGSRVVAGNEQIHEMSLIQKLNEQTKSKGSAINRKQTNQDLQFQNKQLLERKKQMELKISMLKMKNQQLQIQLNLKNKNQTKSIYTTPKHSVHYPKKNAEFFNDYFEVQANQNNNREIEQYVRQLELQLQSKDLQIRALNRLLRQNSSEEMERKFAEMNEMLKRKEQTIKVLEENFDNLESQLNYYKEQSIKGERRNDIQSSPGYEQQQSFTSITSSKDEKMRAMIKKKFGQMLGQLDKKVKKLQIELKHRQNLIQYAEKVLDSLFNLSNIGNLRKKLDILWQGKKGKTNDLKTRSKTQPNQTKKNYDSSSLNRKQLIGKLRLNVIKQAYQDQMTTSLKVT